MKINFLTFVAILLCGYMPFAYAEGEPYDQPQIQDIEPENLPRIESSEDLTFVWDIPGSESETDLSPSEDLTYVQPGVAQFVLDKHFSNFVSSNAKEFVSESNDTDVYYEVLNAYNDMLMETDGFISIDGITNVCNTAFSKLEPKKGTTLTSTEIFSLLKDKCMDFATDLVTIKWEDLNKVAGPCKYDVSKVDGKQWEIKYKDKNSNSGFIRKDGTIAWRFLNPGCMRASDLSCIVLDTEPNGKFAVFQDFETGKKAMHQQLANSEKYRGLTIKQAIEKWAPKKENNTALYVQQIKDAGVDINKVLPNLTDKEFETLEHAIMQKEGWFNGPKKGGQEIKF